MNTKKILWISIPTLVVGATAFFVIRGMRKKEELGEDDGEESKSPVASAIKKVTAKKTASKPPVSKGGGGGGTEYKLPFTNVEEDDGIVVINVKKSIPRGLKSGSKVSIAGYPISGTFKVKYVDIPGKQIAIDKAYSSSRAEGTVKFKV